MKGKKYLSSLMIVLALSLAFTSCSRSPEPTFAITASSTYNNNYPNNALNNEGEKYWHSEKGTPQWWQIKFNTEKRITKFGLQPTCYNGCMIKDFIFQGSNDGKDWRNLFAGQHADTPQIEYYDLGGSQKYYYYRIYIVNVWRNDDFAGIQNIVIK
jgi:hypothetical protein